MSVGFRMPVLFVKLCASVAKIPCANNARVARRFFGMAPCFIVTARPAQLPASTLTVVVSAPRSVSALLSATADSSRRRAPRLLAASPVGIGEELDGLAVPVCDRPHNPGYCRARSPLHGWYVAQDVSLRLRLDDVRSQLPPASSSRQLKPCLVDDISCDTWPTAKELDVGAAAAQPWQGADGQPAPAARAPPGHPPPSPRRV